MLHSLESVNYLKIDPNNFLEFQFSGEEKCITVMQQYSKKAVAASAGLDGMVPEHANSEDDFLPVIKIRIHDITLRELLLF